MVSKKFANLAASLENITNDLLKTAWTEVIIVIPCFCMKACCE